MFKKDKEMQWHEDDNFWIDLADSLFTPEAVKCATSEVDRIIELLSLDPTKKIVDLACGMGRHSLEFARRGYKVTGVDRTASYLELARTQADDEGLSVELIEEDLRRFRRSESFDVALNLFNSFGYFKDPEDDRKVVLNINKSLKRGGLILMDIIGKEVLARDFQAREWEPIEGGFILHERQALENWSWMENRRIVIHNGETREYRFSHRVYSAIELMRLFEECGFTDIKCFGDFKGDPYDNQAKRLIVVASKPK